ncbi:MAG: queuosine precursor transporter [Candidatus Promineifilaceae bacterium]
MPGSRWYPAITAAFATSLVISNIIAVKLITFGPLTLPAAVIIFPVAYIFGDILTEVYGYSRARGAIWIGFSCNLIAVIAIWLAGLLPAAPFWTANTYDTVEDAQRAYDAILGFAPRLLMASFLAFLVGEFLNSYVLARMKLWTEGKLLWTRTIGSTLVGQFADSFIFVTIAFSGIMVAADLVEVILSQWFVKSAYEVIATPLTYWIVNSLKRIEKLDVFDRNTDFNPFKLRVDRPRGK